MSDPRCLAKDLRESDTSTEGGFFGYPGPGRVRVLAFDYPAGSLQPRHHHDVPQLLHATAGVMRVTTPAGFFVVPPARGVWIPAEIPHEISMVSAVSMRTVYLGDPGVPDYPVPAVVGVSPLLRELILALAADEPDGPFRESARRMALEDLLLIELQQLPSLALSLPLPHESRLAALCRHLLAHPGDPRSFEDLALAFGLSARSFRRGFQAELGMNFATWRQQARVVEAVALLVEGGSASAVARRLGYGSVAAFSAMFKRATGFAPTQRDDRDTADK